MSDSLTLQVLNNREALAAVAAQAEGWMETHDAPPKVAYLAMLAVEELVTNCIDYGYDDANEHIIVIEMSIVGGVLTMTFIDDGHAFNPLQDAPAPDFDAELQERRIGGLGIHMLRKLSDGMEYERRDETNRLTLTKRMA